jgi:hypothetical protein
MINQKNEEKEFYMYAMYYKLINKGYSSKKAEILVKRIFNSN